MAIVNTWVKIKVFFSLSSLVPLKYKVILKAKITRFIIIIRFYKYDIIHISTRTKAWRGVNRPL